MDIPIVSPTQITPTSVTPVKTDSTLPPASVAGSSGMTDPPVTQSLNTTPLSPVTSATSGSSSKPEIAPEITLVTENNDGTTHASALALDATTPTLSSTTSAKSADVTVSAVTSGPIQSFEPQTPFSAPSQVNSPQAVSVPPAAATPTTTADKMVTSTSQLANILMRNQVLTVDQVSQLEVDHIQTGDTIEKLIEDRHLVGEEDLSKAKAEAFGVPFIRLSEVGISPEALNSLSETVARRYGILPFAIDSKDRTLSVAMRNPLDLTAIDFAEEKSGYRLVVHFAMPSELDRTIAERYAQSLSSEVTQALQETAQVSSKQQTQQILSNSTEVVRSAPITKIVETILSFAIKARASDVHIEPLEDRTRVRYRIDGILMEKLILPASVHEATISRIKILSNLKIDEKRMPQDGRFNFTSGNEEVDLRVSTLPTIHGEKVVMRLLKKNANIPSLQDLGLKGLALRNVEDSIKVPHGIILVTGPTGSGKTTTLYSVLHQVNTPKVNIMTLEDPVEYQMEGVNQVQINPQAGLTFASGLRSFLRQDPNIIMVGEIRDGETAELAVQASLTGHLVFSTLHTSSAAGALPRLLDMGAEPFLLASSMTLTMGQRVVRLIHPDYKEEYQPEPAVVEDIKQVLGKHFDTWCRENNKDPNKVVLYRAKNDRPQTEPEYKGRMAIFEVMRITPEIGRMILERKSAAELEKSALNDGMLLMKQDGYLKALEGMTTIEEVLRVAQV